MGDTLDGHMVTTSESAKLTVMLTLDNVKPNLTMVSMELTQSHPQLLPPSTLLSLPMPTELLYQLTQLVWLPPPLTLTKKLLKLPEIFMVELLNFKRGL